MPEILSCIPRRRETVTELNSQAGKEVYSAQGEKNHPLLEEKDSRKVGVLVGLGRRR